MILYSFNPNTKHYYILFTFVCPFYAQKQLQAAAVAAYRIRGLQGSCKGLNRNCL